VIVYGRRVLAPGSIIVDATTEVGLVAGLIAVGGFLAHVGPVFQGQGEDELRLATVRGGLGGVAAAAQLNVGYLLLG
jgi:hypothetical protein